MGILDVFFGKKQNTAATAKNRLIILIKQEHDAQGAPDYMPMLRREILEVIRKYIDVETDAVKVDIDKSEGHNVLGISVSLPESRRVGA